MAGFWDFLMQMPQVGMGPGALPPEADPMAVYRGVNAAVPGMMGAMGRMPPLGLGPGGLPANGRPSPFPPGQPTQEENPMMGMGDTAPRARMIPPAGMEPTPPITGMMTGSRTMMPDGTDPNAGLRQLLAQLQQRPGPDELAAASQRPWDPETASMMAPFDDYAAKQKRDLEQLATSGPPTYLNQGETAPMQNRYSYGMGNGGGSFDDEITADLARMAGQRGSSQAGMPGNRMAEARGGQQGMNDFLLDSPDANAERLRQALGIQKPVEFGLGGPQTILGGIRSPGGGNPEPTRTFNEGEMPQGMDMYVDQRRKQALAEQAARFKEQAMAKRNAPPTERDADLADRQANVRQRGILGRDRYLALKESEAMAQALGGMGGGDAMNPVMLAAMGVQPGVIDAILESKWRGEALRAQKEETQLEREQRDRLAQQELARFMAQMQAEQNRFLAGETAAYRRSREQLETTRGALRQAGEQQSDETDMSALGLASDPRTAAGAAVPYGGWEKTPAPIRKIALQTILSAHNGELRDAWPAIQTAGLDKFISEADFEPVDQAWLNPFAWDWKIGIPSRAESSFRKKKGVPVETEFSLF